MRFDSPDELVEKLAHPQPPAARVRTIDWEEIPVRSRGEFTIAITKDGPRILTPWHERRDQAAA